jgi:ABC exporter DevB family membrane fusion protein
MSPQSKVEIEGGRRPRIRRPDLRLGVAVIPFVAIALGGRRGEGPSPAPGPAERSAVHALARLEPEAGLVMVGARPGARVLKVEVHEGDVVKAGALLAVLEGNDQAQQQVDLAVGRKKRALEQRARARQKAKLEREQTDAVLGLRRESLAKQVEITKKKNDTAQGLYTGLSAVGGVAKLPPKDQIELEAALYLLQMQSLKAELELKELDARKGLLAKQRVLEDQELQDGGTEDDLLDRQIKIARTALEQTLVKSPSSGTVLSVAVHPGEVGGGQILAMGDLSSVAARAEVDQSDVGRVRVGDPARAMIDGRPAAGEVTSIGGLVGRNRMRDVDPRAPQDLRVVEVTVRLDRPEVASRFIGMQVDVAIEPASKPSSGAAAP